MKESCATLLTCTTHNHMVLDALEFHPVQYKIIIAHFEQLLNLLKDDSGTTQVNWPPSNEVMLAVGGVGGFGDILHQEQSRQESQDVIVPPIIRKIHPKLAPSVYIKYRRDPLFMYKTVAVCEDCFLVYAELLNSAHRPTTIPRPRAPQASGQLQTWDSSGQHHQRTKCRQQSRRDQNWMPTEAPSIPGPIYSASEVPPSHSDPPPRFSLSIDEIVRRRGACTPPKRI